MRVAPGMIAGAPYPGTSVGVPTSEVVEEIAAAEEVVVPRPSLVVVDGATPARYRVGTDARSISAAASAWSFVHGWASPSWESNRRFLASAGERRFREVPGRVFDGNTERAPAWESISASFCAASALPRVGGVNLQEERAFVPQV